MDLLASVKLELLRSNTDPQHPFRIFYLASLGDYPEVRSVVKRDFSREDMSVIFYTDARTPKVMQISRNDKVSALFYHPSQLLQLRMKGRAQLIGPGEVAYDHYLQQVRQSGRVSDYNSAQAPGTEIGENASVATEDTLHFSAIRILPSYLDILQLGREKHTRKAYRLQDGVWMGSQLVP